MILSDKTLKEMANIISPFEPEKVRIWKGTGAISFGLSAYGYDIRLAEGAYVMSGSDEVIDPKTHKPSSYKMTHGDVTLKPGEYMLATSLERLKIPNNALAIVQGKSTYARCGIVVNVTPLEPGWEGNITMCIMNPTMSSVKIYANEGIAQVLFIKGDQPCENPYKGKYQNSEGVTLAQIGE